MPPGGIFLFSHYILLLPLLLGTVMIPKQYTFFITLVGKALKNLKVFEIHIFYSLERSVLNDKEMYLLAQA
jgi:hypothetical protein